MKIVPFADGPAPGLTICVRTQRDEGTWL